MLVQSIKYEIFDYLIRQCMQGISCLYYYRSMQYIDREGKEDFYGLSAYPDTLYKKVTLLKYFRSYMSEHLLKVRLSLYQSEASLMLRFIRLVLQLVIVL